MRTIVTRSWSFRTYSTKGKAKCIECGKSISKTFSFECREDVLTSKEDWDHIDEIKKKWEAEPHICNSCKKKKIQQERKDITSEYTFMLSKLDELQNQINQIILDKGQRISSVKSMEGKVLLDRDKTEWLIYRISDGWQNNMGFEIQCYKINKQKPWLYTDECRYFSNNKACWSNFSTLEGCIITDEDFSKRRELLNKC